MRLCFIGTSGWVYDWNPNGIDWYVGESGLNAVELNMSFYRIPSLQLVQSWRRKASKLRWAVKIHQAITHRYRLSEKAYTFWQRFRRVFMELDDVIDFYLLQLPPSYTMNQGNIDKLKRFANYVGLGPRLAVEFRHESWLNDRGVEVVKSIGATIVSIDAPIATWITSTNNTVYMRLHGRITWYAYDYNKEELAEIAEAIWATGAERIYVFFNNNHWMLENARQMRDLLREMGCHTPITIEGHS